MHQAARGWRQGEATMRNCRTPFSRRNLRVLDSANNATTTTTRALCSNSQRSPRNSYSPWSAITWKPPCALDMRRSYFSVARYKSHRPIGDEWRFRRRSSHTNNDTKNRMLMMQLRGLASDSDRTDTDRKNDTDPQLSKEVTSNNTRSRPTKKLPKPSPPLSELSRRRTIRRSFRFDNDKEMFREIHRLSLLNKEKSRQKTAHNVYRALLGNIIICGAKLGAWMSSGSSALLSEFIHSVVDCGNQSLLLIGLRDSKNLADRRHPYGYGKSIYFWALVSALGTFFLGAGVSMTHAIGDVLEPSLQSISWEVWTVLGLSFVIDGYVLAQTVRETYETKPENMSYLNHLRTLRDPAVLAVLLEDGAACLGIVIAIAGITASHATGNPIFDGIAGVGISTLLGAMGIALVNVNYKFLLGHAVNKEIVDDIGHILLDRRAIDSIRSVQSQWTGPETFSYKAEVDFDGTYLAAKLMPVYQHEFEQIQHTMDSELQVLLALYAEDVMRTVEREIRTVEALIRKKYPGAEFIELEPKGADMDRLAIDDNLEAELKRVESDALNRYLKSIKKEDNRQQETNTATAKNDDADHSK